MSALLTHQATQPRTTQPAAPARRGLWQRIRQAVWEMNHAARRVVELQAPWSVDQQWHRK
jgi:hypothetical protein